MKDHPILFQGPMIQAIRDGCKTQTRRIINPQPTWNGHYWLVQCPKPIKHLEYARKEIGNITKLLADADIYTCPYGVPGDLLGVREPFRITQVNVLQGLVHGTYTRDGSDFLCDFPDQDMDKYEKWKKPYSGKSSLFMFKSLVRLWLKVKSVRVEQVQEISEADALAEGVLMGSSAVGHTFTARENFAALWDSINAKPKPRYRKKQITHYESYPWKAGRETREHRGKPWHIYGNPFVFATEFERYDK